MLKFKSLYHDFIFMQNWSFRKLATHYLHNATFVIKGNGTNVKYSNKLNKKKTIISHANNNTYRGKLNSHLH